MKKKRFKSPSESESQPQPAASKTPKEAESSASAVPVKTDDLEPVVTRPGKSTRRSSLGAGQGAPFADAPEPVATRSAVPPILFAVLLALIFWGDMYVLKNGGDLYGTGGSFPSRVYHPYRSFAEVERANPVDETQKEKILGRLVYMKACVACHQPNGNGVPGQFPPLPASEWVLAPKPDRLIRIVLNGLQGPIEVKGVQYNNAMVPWKDSLKDEEIAAVLTYIRNEWGNKAASVKVDEVKAIRAATKDKADSYTAEELQKIPDR